ncbi:MAG: hypothetical protein NT075_21170, partial [Chloroflexi bacterium]|nr:hypothetical protein [Chloroflexota bacterium]
RVMNQTEALTTFINRIQRRTLIVGGVGVVLCILGAFLNVQQFFQSYLFGWLYWLGIGLGGFVWVMVHHLSGGRWGLVTRRVHEVSTLVTIVMALLFIPLCFGLSHLYPWARPAEVAADPLLQHKQPYLNVPFFLIRVLIYFAVWIVIAFLLDKWSRDWDRTGSTVFGRRLRMFSGPALAIYGFTMSFAAIDWMMSLEPHWFSTVFGVLIIAEQALLAWCFAIIVLVQLAKWEPLAAITTWRAYNDLGNFLLAAVLFWAYLAFVQFLIMWAGNLPEEVTWYLHRLDGGWQWVAILVLIGHFILPFAALLSGRLKRNSRRLAMVALLVMVIDLIYLHWLIMPAFYPAHFHLHWLDIVTPVTIGGLWLTVFLWWLKRKSLLPLHDVALDQHVTTLQEVQTHG